MRFQAMRFTIRLLKLHFSNFLVMIAQILSLNPLKVSIAIFIILKEDIIELSPFWIPLAIDRK